MGGVAINSNARVLGVDGEPLPYLLYAAGEVTGGIHGHERLAGNSLLDCSVFGHIAGQRAAEEVLLMKQTMHRNVNEVTVFG